MCFDWADCWQWQHSHSLLGNMQYDVFTSPYAHGSQSCGCRPRNAVKGVCMLILQCLCGSSMASAHSMQSCQLKLGTGSSLQPRGATHHRQPRCGEVAQGGPDACRGTLCFRWLASAGMRRPTGIQLGMLHTHHRIYAICLVEVSDLLMSAVKTR